MRAPIWMLIVAVLGSLVPPAGAGFSPWLEYAAMPGSLSGLYPGQAGLTATRVDDFGLGGILDTYSGAPGATDDELWSGTTLRFTVKFKEAANFFAFGYDQDASGGFTKLVDGIPGQSGTVTLAPGTTWAWALSTDQKQWWSVRGLNGTGLDHMLTWQVNGFDDGCTTWLLFWEDGPALGHAYPGDGDYNDLVVEVKGLPEPSMLSLLALGSLVAMRLGVRREWRRRLDGPSHLRAT